MDIVVVPHGDSERIVARSLGSNLRLGMHIHKCNSSIQIAGMARELSSGSFSSYDALYRAQNRLFKKEGKPGNFLIFPIMDTDDCDDVLLQKYLSKEMFRKSAFYKKIEPIFCSPNLDVVMKSIGYPIDPKFKIKSYDKCFPGTSSSIEEAKKLLTQTQNCQNTNIDIFIERCLSSAQGNRYLK